MIRSTSTSVKFSYPFALTGLERPIPPGIYRVDIEEEPIDGLSFLVYRRLATFIRIPVAGTSGVVQDLLVDPKELDRALEIDVALGQTAIRERPGASGSGSAEAQPVNGAQ